MAMGGTSGGAGDIRSGGAFVELYVKDNTEEGIKKANDRLASATASMKSKIDSFSTSAVRMGALVGAAFTAVKMAIDSLEVEALAKVNRELEKSANLSERLAAAVGRNRDKAIGGALAGGMVGPLGGAVGGVGLLQQQLENELNNSSGQAGVLQRAKDELEAAIRVDEDVKSGLGGWFRSGAAGNKLSLSKTRESIEQDVKNATQAVAEAQKRYDDTKEAVRRLREEIEKLTAAQAKAAAAMQAAADAESKAFRMRDAEEFAARSARIGDIQLAGMDERRRIMADVAAQTAQAMGNLTGSFAGQFGGANASQRFGGSGGTRNIAEEVAKHTDYLRRIADSQEREEKDVAAIRAEGGDVYDQ